MSDLIKRSDAIKVLKDSVVGMGGDDFYEMGVHIDDIEAVVNAIPSADRPSGKWIDKGRNLWGCSNCGMEIYSESEQDRNEFHKWCSRCGARMRGADDEM